MDEATGEAAGTGLRVAFDRRLKLEFHGATVTSDTGLLAFRETGRRAWPHRAGGRGARRPAHGAQWAPQRDPPYPGVAGRDRAVVADPRCRRRRPRSARRISLTAATSPPRWPRCA